MTDPDELITNAEAAKLLGLEPNTLERWRHFGRGPAYLKLGHMPQCPVRYRRSVVMEWLEKQTFESTSAHTARSRAHAPMRINAPAGVKLPWETAKPASSGSGR